MRKWYRRRRPSRKKLSTTILTLLFFLLMVFFPQYWKIIFPVFVGVVFIVLVLLLVKLIRRKSRKWNVNGTESTTNNNGDTAPGYSAKKAFMTDCEKAFFDVFQKIVAPNYTVQPQINLASIIDKNTQSRYRAELFRNIDFGIFDNRYSLFLLIEINDKTHYQKDRYARDKKVHAICEEAGIPLITFWSHYGINEKYIYDTLSAYLPLLARPTENTEQSDKENDCASGEALVHHMKLNPRPFEMIKCGQKTIEMRLFDEKRQHFREGDELTFTNRETGESISTKIKKIHHFATFEELYRSLPLMQCGYTAEEIEKASPADMQQYFPIEEQQKYGVVGIELFPPSQIADASAVGLTKN